MKIFKFLIIASDRSSNLPDVTGAAGNNIPPLDTQWIETKSKKAALKMEKLDTDLKNYKSNSIKESIRLVQCKLNGIKYYYHTFIYVNLYYFFKKRRGHDDLGDHYLDCGDLNNALKCYSRARDYCTSGKHVINMCLNVIKVRIFFCQYCCIFLVSYIRPPTDGPSLA